MRKPIDHQHRVGGAYESKGEMSEEMRARLAERMKEYNRKTGKHTALANRLVKVTRKPKP